MPYMYLEVTTAGDRRDAVSHVIIVLELVEEVLGIVAHVHSDNIERPQEGPQAAFMLTSCRAAVLHVHQPSLFA
eukprot:4174981-Prymnesium_polylepis.1